MSVCGLVLGFGFTEGVFDDGVFGFCWLCFFNGGLFDDDLFVGDGFDLRAVDEEFGGVEALQERGFDVEFGDIEAAGVDCEVVDFAEFATCFVNNLFAFE